MAFIVEDGSVVANANSYISVADADTYHQERTHSSVWNNASVETKQQALMFATRLLDYRVEWKGTRVSTTSALYWPRSGVCDYDGIEFSKTAIPQWLKDATAELARYLISSDRTAPPDTAGFKRLKVDVIEIEMSDSGAQGQSAQQSTFPRLVVEMIAPYGRVRSFKGSGRIRRT